MLRAAPPTPDRREPVVPHLGRDPSLAARARLALVSRSARRVRTAGIGLFLAVAFLAHILTVLAIVALPRLGTRAHPPAEPTPGQATIEMVMQKTPTVGGSQPQAPAPPRPRTPPAKAMSKTANAPPPLNSRNAQDQLSASSDDATAPAAQSPASPPDAKPGQQAPRVNLDPSGDPGYGEATGENVIPANPDSANLNQPPIYPVTAAEHGEQGAVYLLVTVAPDGHPADVEIASSSGYKILDEEALRAVSRWHFHPEIRDGKPVQSFFNQEIQFGLRER